MSTRICDISRPLRTGMPVWPGEPKHSKVRTWHLTKYFPADVPTGTLSAGTCTPADGPSHYATAGPPIGAITLDTASVHALQREIS